MRRRVVACVATVLLLWGSAVEAHTDYLPDNGEWNGLSELANIAAGLQLPLEIASELRWEEITQQDLLLILYPRATIRPARLRAFLEKGGRALVADDFGQGAKLLESLGLRLSREKPKARFSYRDTPGLPIALPRQRHPLTAGIQGVMTNHPAVLRSSLPTLLGFAEGQQVLTAGTLGKGRFVALSDPSVLINGMLRFKGNLRFATNLLSELGEGRRRAVLFTGHFRLGPATAAKSRQQRAAQELNSSIDRLNDFALTVGGMRVLAFVLAGVVLGALLLVLPMPRRDLDGRWLRPGPQLLRLDDSALAAGQLREEMEQRLGALLDAPGPVSAIHPRWITERVRRRAGGDAAEICHKLLDALRHVPYAPDADALGRTGKRELASIYELSRKLLSAMRAEDRLPALGGPRDATTSDERHHG